MLMQIDQSSTSSVVFLLVDDSDMYSPVEGATPQVSISANGGVFAELTNRTSSIGAGWYRLDLTPAETATPGPLIVRASAPGTAEWRDIIQIVGPSDSAGGGGTTEPPTSVNLVRNGDFGDGTRDWIFYTNGNGSWQVESEAAKASVVRPNTNTQLYQTDIVLTPGQYLLKFDARSEKSSQMGVFLHQHLPPRRNLGVAKRNTLSSSWQSYSYNFTVTQSEDNARLRFWFVENIKNNDNFYIRNVSITSVA